MKQELKLVEAKKLLEVRGLKPSDYKHLSYEEIIKLAKSEVKR